MKTRTQKSLIAAINRKLIHEGQRLCTTRFDRDRGDLGDHYIIDLRTGVVSAAHVKLDALAREMGIEGGAA